MACKQTEPLDAQGCENVKAMPGFEPGMRVLQTLVNQLAHIERTFTIIPFLDAMSISDRGVGMFWLDHDVGE